MALTNIIGVRDDNRCERGIFVDKIFKLAAVATLKKQFEIFVMGVNIVDHLAKPVGRRCGHMICLVLCRKFLKKICGRLKIGGLRQG